MNMLMMLWVAGSGNVTNPGSSMIVPLDVSPLQRNFCHAVKYRLRSFLNRNLLPHKSVDQTVEGAGVVLLIDAIDGAGFILSYGPCFD